VLIDPARTPSSLAALLTEAGARLIGAPDPCLLAKSVKNSTELEGARAAHRRDGVAVCRFLAWLDRTTAEGAVDEIGAAEKLEDFRRQSNALRDISFDTISSAGEHGAIVHYRVTRSTNRRLEPGTLYLIDSGAQYADGTTDITRTVAVGAPAPEMRRHFTLVLKAHIALATARFPAGTRGVDLDPLARAPLWRHGLDYGHGTGHGVGSYLCVHEGPQSISRTGLPVLQPGMILSIEPGLYIEGAYGIRIENLVIITPPELVAGGNTPMMAFETLTLAPIDRRLIDADLLTQHERDWVDAYHARVAREIGPQLAAPDRAWLEAATAPL
jgi:Xaa-Pro aminopeptidase